jgi:hypothetical protein
LNVDDKLAVLWSSIVDDVKFDLPNHAIELQVKTFHNSVEEQRKILIEGVVGFLWVNDSTPDGRTNTDPWDYIDLASVYTPKQSDVVVRGQFDQYGLKPNLAFEIWGSVLLVEAAEITMGGQNFSLILNE